MHSVHFEMMEPGEGTGERGRGGRKSQGKATSVQLQPASCGPEAALHAYWKCNMPWASRGSRHPDNHAEERALSLVCLKAIQRLEGWIAMSRLCDDYDQTKKHPAPLSDWTSSHCIFMSFQGDPGVSFKTGMSGVQRQPAIITYVLINSVSLILH